MYNTFFSSEDLSCLRISCISSGGEWVEQEVWQKKNMSKKERELIATVISVIIGRAYLFPARRKSLLSISLILIIAMPNRHDTSMNHVQRYQLSIIASTFNKCTSVQ